MKRKYYRESKTSRALRVIKILTKLFILGMVAVGLTGFFIFVYYAKDLPRPEQFEERSLFESTKIYDRSGEVLLYEIYGEQKRTIVPLEKIPDHLKQAVIAAEDANFYNHFGVDPEGIFRAILIDLRLGKPVYGGSTITQQLIRSTFFTTRKTIKRKTREVILALELDRRYSKDQILEWYLNQVPFGANTYGVEAAAQVYFNQSVSELSLAQAAVLAALVRAPSRLSPYSQNKKELLTRKNYILDRMAEEHFVSQSQADKAKQEKIEFSMAIQPMRAPHLVSYVIEHYLKPKYGSNLEFLKRKGLRIYTSLDWDLQRQAKAAIKAGVEANQVYDASNGALVAIDPNTGQILAMVGSKDYFDKEHEGQVNVALRSRQPGSAFKPFAYATAFKKGYNASTTVVDEKTSFGVWGGEEYIPRNYDKRFRGEVTLREALAQSINVPSVKVLVNLAGIEDTIETAQELGITGPLPQVPSLVLGGGGVKLLDLVSAYGVFATQGLKVKSSPILKIEDSEGNLIYKNNYSSKRVLKNEVAKLITDILSDNEARAPMFGLHSALYFEDYKVAAKTGTTDDFRDAWTIGYTPELVAGVWVGNNDNSPMAKKPGVMLSAPIWHDFMEQAIKKLN